MNARFVNIVLLALCLGLLGTLVFTILYLKREPGTEAEAEPNFLTNSVTHTQIAVRKINPSNLLAALANRPIHWSAVESPNYEVYIANLRTIGCPEETIRDIILTDVAKVYSRKRAQLRTRYPFKYWVPNDPWADRDPAQQEYSSALEALNQEQRTLVRQILGVDYDQEMAKYFDDPNARGAEDLSFLPEAKREQMLALHDKYSAMEEAVYARSKGVLLPQDEAELLRIRKARQDELATFLSPQEIEDYQLRTSDIANALRDQLAGFQPSEQEFRRIFRLQQAYETAFADLDPRDPATRETKDRAQQAASDALNEELRKTLGDARFNEYQRLQDEDYRYLLQLSDRLDLPNNVAQRVYDMRRDAELQKQRLEADANLTPEQRQRALSAIARETENALSSVMTPQALAAYKNAGASWLTELRQSEVPPPVLQPESVNLPPLPPGVIPSIPPP